MESNLQANCSSEIIGRLGPNINISVLRVSHGINNNLLGEFA